MTPSSAAPVVNPPRWSRFIPWMFVGAFVAIIAVNGALIYFAQSSFSGLETENAYEKGLRYNQTLEAAAAQDKLGWHGEITLQAVTDSQYELAVQFANRQAKPIDGLRVEAHIRRPSNEGMDQDVTLQHRGAGRYVAEVALPALGQWDVRIVAHDGDASWQESQRLFVK